MKTFITVTNQVEGIHRYENAPVEVEFLRNDHRHMFYIKSKIQVFNEDRELEFIMVKHLINKYLMNRTDHQYCYHLGNNSCEMIANDIYKLLQDNYGSERYISVEVSEDNENSAIIEGEI